MASKYVTSVSKAKFIKTMDFFGTQWAKFLGGLIGSTYGIMKRAFTSAWGIAKSYDAMSVATSRHMGLTYRDSISYTQTLISRTRDLAAAYGITAEKAAALQDSVAKATSRAIILSNTQAESLVAVSKVLGEQTASEFQNKVVTNLGGSIAASMNVAQDAYTRASRMGLSAVEYSNKIAQNLNLVNSLHFRSGVDGLARMTALSERLGFNMQSLSNVAEKFSNLETALPSAASLQALGGSFSVYGADPLSWMYASMGDAEQLTRMVSDLVKGLSTFNAKSGIAELGVASKQYLRAAATQLGMSYEELANIANRQATEQFARSRVGNLFDNITNGDEEFKNYILNKVQWNEKVQKFELTTANGKTIDIEKISQTREGIEALRQEWKQSTMSDREAFIDAAQRITSYQERLEGINSMIGAMLAQKLMPFLELAKTFLFNNIQAITSVAAKGISLLTNPSFWVATGKEIVALSLGGFASIVQNAVMWLLGPIGKGVQLLGWLLDAIGFATNTNWAQTLGKWLDGRALGVAMYKGVHSVLDAMAPTNEVNAQIRNTASEIASLANAAYEDVNKAWEIASKQSVEGYNATLRTILESKKGERVYTKDAQLESIDNRLASIAASSESQLAEQIKANGEIGKASTSLGTLKVEMPRDDNQSDGSALAAAISIAGVGVPFYFGKRLIKNKVRSLFASKPSVKASPLPTLTAVPQSQVQIPPTPIQSAPSGFFVDKKSGLIMPQSQVQIPPTPTQSASSGFFVDKKSGLIMPQSQVQIPPTPIQSASSGFFVDKKSGLIIPQSQVQIPPTPIQSAPSGFFVDKKSGLIMPNSYQVEQQRARVSSKPFARPSGKSVGQLRTMVKMKAPMARRGVAMLGGLKGIGTGLGLSLGGAAISMGTNALVEREIINKYGAAHYGGNILGKGLAGAAMGSFFGPMGAAIGGLAGAAMGAIDLYHQKSQEEQADKQRVSSVALARLGISQVYTQATEGYVPSSPYAAAFGSPQVEAQATTGSQRYISPTSSLSTMSPSRLELSDININISGTIRLEGGNNSRGLDINSLMKDQAFVTQIKDLIKDSINKGMNNGRAMKDASSIGGGLPKQVYANV